MFSKKKAGSLEKLLAGVNHVSCGRFNNRSRGRGATHVREGPRLRRDGGSGGRRRGRAAAVLVVEGVARVRVVDVDALHDVVVEDARRRGGQAEAQAGLVGSTEGETAAVRGRVRVRVEAWRSGQHASSLYLSYVLPLQEGGGATYRC